MDKYNTITSGVDDPLEPMLCYCKKVLPELLKEDPEKLSIELLEILKNFRMGFRAKKKSFYIDLNLKSSDKAADSAIYNLSLILKNNNQHHLRH